MSDCWNCFNRMLADCDNQNPEGTRREAGYQAANTFFSWCLGQTGNAGALRSEVNFDTNRTAEYDIRDGMRYDVFTPAGATADQVAVFVRLFGGDEPRQVRLDRSAYTILDRESDAEPFTIVIGAGLDVSAETLGVVTALEVQGAVVDAFAFTADVTDSFDLDANGVFDDRDRVEAVLRHLRGELDKETMTRIVSE